jgi:hypothetical protein
MSNGCEYCGGPGCDPTNHTNWFKAPDWRDTKQPNPEHWPRLLPLAGR